AEPYSPSPLPEQDGGSLPRLVAVMRRLLAPDGCPWDQKQSYESLRRYVTEEAAEVVDAIDDGDREALCDELGDLLLQVVFLAEMGRRDGHFGPDDVVEAIVQKLVRRHPHVFAGVVVADADEVMSNWERIKAEERREGTSKDKGVVGGVPRSLPALTRAQRVGEKAASVGFDWPDDEGPRSKVSEELAELDEAMAGGNPRRVEQEFGDLLFATVNLARHHGIDAEAALRGTSNKFVARFEHVEARVKEEHGGFDRGAVSLEAMDAYWDEAKAREGDG
ncbi:MAG: nucleoside triphosphate pyrophosphohydrolase, partial [Polyangiaceae bacterium]